MVVVVEVVAVGGGTLCYPAQSHNDAPASKSATPVLTSQI